MPDFVHGRLSRIYVNGVDISRVITSANANGGYDTAESTTFGQGYQSFITGLRQGGEGSLEGRVEKAGQTLLRRVVRDAEGRDDSLFSIVLGADAPGQVGVACRGLLTTKEFSATTEDVAQVTLGFAGNRGLDDTIALQPGATILTATGNGTAVDDDTDSAAGVQAIGYLHVLELTGGTTPTIVVKIQDSPDNSVWTDLITFDSAGASAVRTAQRKVVSDPPARYVRATWTITGTPTAARVAVQFARGKAGEDLS